MYDAIAALLAGVRYIGERTPGQGGPGSVFVSINGVRAYDLPPRNDIRNHSPDGFQWGYGGSGPAQLALALCYDASYWAMFHKRPSPVELKVVPRRDAEAIYQDVKRLLVARIDTTHFDISLASVLGAMATARDTRGNLGLTSTGILG